MGLRVGVRQRRAALAVAVAAVGVAAAAPAAGASVRFERHQGLRRPRHAGQVRPGRRARDRRRRRATSSDHGPGHVGQRRLLRAAGQVDRPRRTAAGRSGRSSAARTSSRTTRSLDPAKAGKATPQQLFDYYLGYLTDPAITTHYRLIPDASVAFAKRLGHAGRGGGPAPRRARGQKPRRQGRARRPLAGRLDHDRLRDVGLRRQARRQGPRGARLHRRRQRARPVTADAATRTSPT